MGQGRTFEVEDTSEDSVTLELMIGGRKVPALMDTGAKPSVIDFGTIQTLGLEEDIVEEPSRVYGLCKAPVQVKGYIEIPIQVGQHEPRMIRLQVLESNEPTLLLGRSFMKQFGTVLFDWKRGKIKLGEDWVDIIATSTGGTLLFRAQTAIRDEELEIVKESPNRLDIDKKLDEKNCEELKQLCREFSDRFAINPKRPERTKDEKHYIDTGGAAPIKVRPRRFPPGWEKEIESQVQEMMENNICKPSKSPWASNVVLVRKRDGTLRLAIDYRKLNDVTKKDAYSLPDIQSILDKLKGARFFTSLDVASAYWCVPVHEPDIEKTAFHTHRGQFEMTVMPFGLCNSQATYQRLMDKTFHGLDQVQCFVDDCLIYSDTFEKHVEDIKATFERLRESNIQLKVYKCHFGYQEVNFLGHRINVDGRRPLESIQTKLQQFPHPSSVRELQGFLGSVNYYRSYIPGMAQIAHPLYTLTKKGAPWIWTKECDAAFNELRYKLINEPVTLAFPDWNDVYYVEADASGLGVAAVLSQKDQQTGILRPISYFSSALDDSQKNYSAGQLED